MGSLPSLSFLPQFISLEPWQPHILVPTLLPEYLVCKPLSHCEKPKPPHWFLFSQVR